MARAGMNSQQWRFLGLGLATLTLAGLILVGCGSTGKTPSGRPAELSAAHMEQAQRQYAQLKKEHSLHRDRKSLELVASLLDYYPAFPRNDEVLTLGMSAAERLGDLPQSLDLADELLAEFPDSPLVDQTLLSGADIAAAGRDTLQAADYMIRYHDRDPARALRSDGISIAAKYLKPLDTSELAGLMSAYPRSDLWPYLGYLQVGLHMDDEDFSDAEQVVLQLEALLPEHRWTEAARQRLGGVDPAADRPRRLSSGPVHPEQVGVLCPLTGRYGVLGNAFYDAAHLALEDVNTLTGRHFELKVEDTEGDPVAAALAARRLSEEAGSMAVVGALMSAQTVAAAVVTDVYGVPLVSPTATNDHIWQLGDGIYQTNMTGIYEARLLAQVAVKVLLKQRYAIIYPATPEGKRDADVFRAEVEQLGAEIVAEASYPPQGTDFKDPIMEVRKARPEVIFTPATVDQMVLLGPQLDFYHAGVLVLGLSNWNSERLLERAGPVMQRAMFPSDLAMFPPEWTGDFNARWDGTNYPREARNLALRAYQATRILLDTMHESGAINRGQLTQALGHRLATRDVEAEGPDSFTPTVRMFSGKTISPFPAAVFSEAWDLTEGAFVDSLAVDMADSLVVPVEADLDEPEAE